MNFSLMSIKPMSKAARTILSLVLGLSMASGLSAQSVEQLTNTEKAKREEAVIALRIKLDQADAARANASKPEELLGTALLYEEAVNHMNRVGPYGGIDSERDRVIAGMSEVRLAMAKVFQKSQQFYEADQEVTRILKLDAENADALAFKAQNDRLIARYTGRQPSRDAIANIPEVREAKVAASTMVQDGKLFLELNKLEEAEAKLNEAKELDPESDAVWYYLSILNQKKYQREIRKREITSQDKMVEVVNYWDPNLNKNELPVANPIVSTNLVYTSKGRQNIISKLDRIVLDEVEFDGLPLSEVVAFLHREAMERDPEGEGINLLISNTMETEGTNGQRPFNPFAMGGMGGMGGGMMGGGMGMGMGMGMGQVDPLTGMPALPPAPGEAIDLYSVSVTITPPLKNVKLGQVLDLVTSVADSPIKYSVLDYAVVLTHKLTDPGTTDKLYTRIFRV
ncbi:MAG: hypothetical protein EBU26_14120, partial [Verrucomicrobia bacterium]|nr:hypothetical protein [Verrucomicrobiota bacterium]